MAEDNRRPAITESRGEQGRFLARPQQATRLAHTDVTIHRAFIDDRADFPRLSRIHPTHT